MKVRSDKRAQELGLSDHEFQLIRNLCRKFVNSRDSMDDLLQVAFIGLVEAFAKYSWFPDIDSAIEDERIDISHRPAFIYRVVINSIVGFIKKSRNDALYNAYNHEIDQDDAIDESFRCPGASSLLTEDMGTLENIYPSTIGNDGIDAVESSVYVESLLACIPDCIHRRIMHLFLIEGKSRSEIANIVGIPRGRVGKIVNENKVVLREVYERE